MWLHAKQTLCVSCAYCGVLQAMGRAADQVAEKAEPTAQKITDVAQEQTEKVRIACSFNYRPVFLFFRTLGHTSPTACWDLCAAKQHCRAHHLLCVHV
jgi:hypothetical protein